MRDRLSRTKVLDRAAQAVTNARLRLPPEELTRERDIRAAASRVVLPWRLRVDRQRPADDLADHFGQI
jgi:hypothetical protein